VIAALAAALVGYAVDRFGARRIALTGCFLTAAAIGSLSLINGSIISYWLAWGFVALGMSLGAYLPWIRGVISYFSQSRGLAIAAALCGASLSGIVTPLLSTFFIGKFGWRIAYLCLAVTLFAVIFPVAWRLFSEAPRAERASSAPSARPEAVEANADITIHQALRNYQFWLMAVSFLLAGGTMVGIGVHLMPLLQDRGLTPMQSAGAMGFMSLGALSGRLSSGYLLDRMPAPSLAAIALSFSVAGCGILLSAADGGWLYVAAALFGVPIGATPALIPFLAARCFGLTNHGTIYGSLQAAFNVGGASLPPVLGWLYERAGNYKTALLVIAAGQILSAISLQFLGPYRKGAVERPRAAPAANETGSHVGRS
jgi:MFS family permease